MTTYAIGTVNEIGLTEIARFLSETLNNPPEFFSYGELAAWAKDAEFQMREGNAATIEVPARRALSGRTECLVLSVACLDVETVEIVDDDEDQP